MPVLNLYMIADFGRKDRQVRLEGEGYFEVARNVGCPFTVRTDVLDVTVLGTSFNVRLTPMPGPSRSICSKVAWR